jgi:hypothetical protein
MDCSDNDYLTTSQVQLIPLPTSREINAEQQMKPLTPNPSPEGRGETNAEQKKFMRLSTLYQREREAALGEVRALEM